MHTQNKVIRNLSNNKKLCQFLGGLPQLAPGATRPAPIFKELDALIDKLPNLNPSGAELSHYLSAQDKQVLGHQSQSCDGNFFILLAVGYGHYDLISYLIAKGMNINFCSAEQKAKTTLMAVIETIFKAIPLGTPIAQFITEPIKQIDCLLANGADPGIVTPTGATALSYLIAQYQNLPQRALAQPEVAVLSRISEIVTLIKRFIPLNSLPLVKKEDLYPSQPFVKSPLQNIALLGIHMSAGKAVPAKLVQHTQEIRDLLLVRVKTSPVQMSLLTEWMAFLHANAQHTLQLQLIICYVEASPEYPRDLVHTRDTLFKMIEQNNVYGANTWLRAKDFDFNEESPLTVITEKRSFNRLTSFFEKRTILAYTLWLFAIGKVDINMVQQVLGKVIQARQQSRLPFTESEYYALSFMLDAGYASNPFFVEQLSERKPPLQLTLSKQQLALALRPHCETIFAFSVLTPSPYHPLLLASQWDDSELIQKIVTRFFPTAIPELQDTAIERAIGQSNGVLLKLLVEFLADRFYESLIPFTPTKLSSVSSKIQEIFFQCIEFDDVESFKGFFEHTRLRPTVDDMLFWIEQKISRRPDQFAEQLLTLKSFDILKYFLLEFSRSPLPMPPENRAFIEGLKALDPLLLAQAVANNNPAAVLMKSLFGKFGIVVAEPSHLTTAMMPVSSAVVPMSSPLMMDMSPAASRAPKVKTRPPISVTSSPAADAGAALLLPRLPKIFRLRNPDETLQEGKEISYLRARAGRANSYWVVLKEVLDNPVMQRYPNLPNKIQEFIDDGKVVSARKAQGIVLTTSYDNLLCYHGYHFMACYKIKVLGQGGDLRVMIIRIEALDETGQTCVLYICCEIRDHQGNSY